MRTLANTIVANTRPRSHQRAVRLMGRGLGLVGALIRAFGFNRKSPPNPLKKSSSSSVSRWDSWPMGTNTVNSAGSVWLGSKT
jgi:hypothetical protein